MGSMRMSPRDRVYGAVHLAEVGETISYTSVPDPTMVAKVGSLGEGVKVPCQLTVTLKPAPWYT